MSRASLRTFQHNIENEVTNYNIEGKASPTWTSEYRAFVFYIVVIYVLFLQWGYVQEKITVTKYPSNFPGEEGVSYTWHFPYVLSLSTATCNVLVANLVTYLTQPVQKTHMLVFWPVALSTVVASPIGYMALDYLSYPMMMLAKASKPVPVILAGSLFFQRTYGWHMYVGSVLICAGIFLFSFYKETAVSPGGSASAGGAAAAAAASATVASTDSEDISEAQSAWKLLIGLLYISTHLGLESFVCNKQDYIFETYSAKPLEMMRHSNAWQAFFYAIFVSAGYLLWGAESELGMAWPMLQRCSSLRWDIGTFAACASVGQILLLGFIQRYGSLNWIKLNLTRQFCTVIISVIAFKHRVSLIQYLGICSVFCGVTLEIVVQNSNRAKQRKIDKDMEKEEELVGEEEVHSEITQVPDGASSVRRRHEGKVKK